MPTKHLDANGVPADTHFNSEGLGKGIVWVNGFNIGRYWATTGPQMTLYIPGPLLRAGRNDLVVLELDAVDSSNPQGALPMCWYPTQSRFIQNHVFLGS